MSPEELLKETLEKNKNEHALLHQKLDKLEKEKATDSQIKEQIEGLQKSLAEGTEAILVLEKQIKKDKKELAIHKEITESNLDKKNHVAFKTLQNSLLSLHDDYKNSIDQDNIVHLGGGGVNFETLGKVIGKQLGSDYTDGRKGGIFARHAVLNTVIMSILRHTSVLDKVNVMNVNANEGTVPFMERTVRAIWGSYAELLEAQRKRGTTNKVKFDCKPITSVLELDFTLEVTDTVGFYTKLISQLAEDIDLVLSNSIFNGAVDYDGNAINANKTVSGILTTGALGSGSEIFTKPEIIQTKSSGGANFTYDFEDVSNLIVALKQGYRQNSNLYMSRAEFEKWRLLKSTEGVPLLQPNNMSGSAYMVWGHQVEVIEFMPTSNDAGTKSVILGDLQKAYTVFASPVGKMQMEDITEFPNMLFKMFTNFDGFLTCAEGIKILQKKA